MTRKIQIVIPHPHVKPIHVKHTAAIFTMVGGLTEAFIQAIPHLGAIFFVIGGCLAIYEPHLVHEAKIEDGE